MGRVAATSGLGRFVLRARAGLVYRGGMARASSKELVPALPVLAWYDAGRITPLRLGLVVFFALLLVRVVVTAFAGRLDVVLEDGQSIELREVRIGFVTSLLLGYALAAYGWSAQALRTQLERLRPLFAGSARALEEAHAQAGHISARAQRRVFGWGLAIAFSIPFLVDRDPALYLRAEYWHPENILNWLALPLGGVVALVLRSLWEDAWRLSRLADRVERLDLFEPRQLAPFGSQALRMALLTVLFPSIFAVLLRDRGFAALILVLGIAGAALATTAFLVPVQGIHRRLVQEKEAELARVRGALRGDAAALDKSALRAWRGHASVADLLAYEARIEGVREYPFDVPTLARFAAFLLLPLGSWLGGALVERVVSILLG